MKKNLLAPLQFGFRKKVSVEDAALFFTESVQQEIQYGEIVHAVLLDLSKAFGSLSREILSSKLKSLGFSSSAISFIKSFLSDRLQQVSLNGVKLDWIELKQVPQGTILGPVLFNLYVNDLTGPGQITEDARIIQYADDCLLFCSHQDPHIALQCLQINILKLECYFKSHRLNLNGSKTEFITFSRKTDKRQLDSETVVKKKCECKYLGITLDQYLSFQTQVKKVLKNMAIGIKTIEFIQHKFPTTVLVVLFHALIISHFENSAIFFTQISPPLLLSLEKQMNWA